MEDPTTVPNNQARMYNACFSVALLIVIIGIELAFPSWSTAQMYALGVAAIVFGSIIAWRTCH